MSECERCKIPSSAFFCAHCAVKEARGRSSRGGSPATLLSWVQWLRRAA